MTTKQLTMPRRALLPAPAGEQEEANEEDTNQFIPDRKTMLAATNSYIKRLVEEINGYIDVQLRGEAVRDLAAFLSLERTGHQRALDKFRERACALRDTIIFDLQRAKSNPERFKYSVKSDIRRHRKLKSPVRLVANMPQLKATPLGMRIEQKWRELRQKYHFREYWSLRRARNHVRNLEQIRDNLIQHKAEMARVNEGRARMLDHVRREISALRLKLMNPPHHIYEDAWRVYENYYNSVVREIRRELVTPLESSSEEESVGEAPEITTWRSMDGVVLDIPVGYGTTRNPSTSLATLAREAGGYNSAPITCYQTDRSYIEEEFVHSSKSESPILSDNIEERNTLFNEPKEPLGTLTDVDTAMFHASTSNLAFRPHDDPSPASVVSMFNSDPEEDTPGTSPGLEINTRHKRSVTFAINKETAAVEANSCKTYS